MGWSNDQFIGELVIPGNATTGARITINQNQDGAIKVYDASNVLVAEISPSADVIKALNGSGPYAKLDPRAPSGIADVPGPGLVLGGMTSPADVEDASLTEFDDEFSRGLYLRTSSPVADPDAQEGIDYAAIRMAGRFHGGDPFIQLSAGSVPDAPDGFVSLNGLIVDANSVAISYGDFNEWTPFMGGDGAATYSARTGYWQRIGPMIFFTAYFVVNAAGTGAVTLAMTAPTNIDRSTRQHVPVACEGLAAGDNGSCMAVAFSGGSGNIFDRIRNSVGANIVGSDLLAGAILTVEGWYREEI